MQLTKEQAHSYRTNGFVVCPNLFCASEVQTLREALPALHDAHQKWSVVEEGSDVTRSVMGGHSDVDAWGRFVRHPRLVSAAEQLLLSRPSLYQFKVNAKEGFKGAEWSWHQDFIFWHKEDGMVEPLALTVAVFLDTVYPFNGPMLVLRGSHRKGLLDMTGDAAGDWQANWRARLKYTLGDDIIRAMVAEHEIVALTGEPGTAVFFDCNLVHGSSLNITPHRRAIAFASYISVHTSFTTVAAPRPDFIANRFAQPVNPLDDDCLLSFGSSNSAGLERE